MAQMLVSPAAVLPMSILDVGSDNALVLKYQASSHFKSSARDEVASAVIVSMSEWSRPPGTRKKAATASGDVASLAGTMTTKPTLPIHGSHTASSSKDPSGSIQVGRATWTQVACCNTSSVYSIICTGLRILSDLITTRCRCSPHRNSISPYPCTAAH
jgi:hypothetical protein